MGFFRSVRFLHAHNSRCVHSPLFIFMKECHVYLSGLVKVILCLFWGVTMHSSCIYFFPFISRPQISETTALGAAYAAGLAVGFWQSTEELQAKWQVYLHACVGDGG